MKILSMKYCGNIICNCFIIIFLFSIYSCKKFLELPAPVTSINAENVYSNDATAAAVLTGIYTNLSRDNISAKLSIIPGMTADELELFSISNREYFACATNNLTPNLNELNLWSYFYVKIFATNVAIEGLQNSTTLTPSVKKQLLGEAKFLRGFMFFYLVNYYGDIPLAISTDYKTNTNLPRVSKAIVYTQIIKDLSEAESLLTENYVEADAISRKATTERVRPNKWSATALLARVYLFNSDFVNAELKATEIINKKDLYDLMPLNDVFLKSSKESIWQLQVVGLDYGANTEEGRVFVLPSDGPSDFWPVYLKKQLIESFQSGDQRKVNWTANVSNSGNTYYFANKYKIGAGLSSSAEYPVILRLGEQYLIRAEARIQTGKIAEGISDLNIIRKRATDLSADINDQLPQLSVNLNKEASLVALEYEKRIELFTEMGSRWFDLKRTNRADAVLRAEKGNNWQTTDQLFPIPQYDLDKNTNLSGHQNPGY